MDKVRTTTGVVMAAFAAVVLLSGCGTTEKVSGWLRGDNIAPDEESVIIGAPDLETYVTELYELSTGDPRKQSNIYEDASDTARLTPGPSSTLRLGLVLATPGHPQSDPNTAARLLHEVLDQEPLLTTDELALATIYLEQAQLLASPTVAAARFRESSARAARASETEASRRIESLLAENQRLREALADAEQKLEANTTSERSIRE